MVRVWVQGGVKIGADHPNYSSESKYRALPAVTVQQ